MKLYSLCTSTLSPAGGSQTSTDPERGGGEKQGSARRQTGETGEDTLHSAPSADNVVINTLIKFQVAEQTL